MSKYENEFRVANEEHEKEIATMNEDDKEKSKKKDEEIIQMKDGHVKDLTAMRKELEGK